MLLCIVSNCTIIFFGHFNAHHPQCRLPWSFSMSTMNAKIYHSLRNCKASTLFTTFLPYMHGCILKNKHFILNLQTTIHHIFAIMCAFKFLNTCFYCFPIIYVAKYTDNLHYVLNIYTLLVVSLLTFVDCSFILYSYTLHLYDAQM
jgi:hypothetical protein